MRLAKIKIGEFILSFYMEDGNMFDIDIKLNDINILNVKRKDILPIHRLLLPIKTFNLRQLYQRFLEYYISENDFFLKIMSDKEIIGIINGRVEFKNLGEVWIGYFYINNNELINMGNMEIENNIISSVMQYFNNEYGIKDFYISIDEKDKQGLKFWTENGYGIFRVSKDYYNNNGTKRDMVIMKNISTTKYKSHN